MTVLNDQMQQAMNAHFTDVRIDVMIERVLNTMTFIAEETRKRPSLDGCEANDIMQSHPDVKRNKDDTAMTLIETVASGGALSSMAANMAVDTYANRKAAQARPQDHKKYTPRQEREIRQANRESLELFQNLNEKLQTLYAFSSCQGVTHVDIMDNDEIRPSNLKPKPKPKPQSQDIVNNMLAQASEFAEKNASKPHAAMTL